MKHDAVIDVGNSSTLIGIVMGDTIQSVDQFPTDTFEQRLPALHLSQYGRVVVSSVVPNADVSFKHLNNVHFVTYQNLPDLGIDVDCPEEVGSDRLVTALAGFKRSTSDCLVIDSGTAVTCCYVDQEGVYQGGIIFPGMRISSLALASHTAKVPLIYVSPKDQLLGKTTKEAVETGLYRGYIYLINGFIESYRQRYPTVTVIGAGRGLSVLREQLAIDDFVEDLVLDGLLWCLKSLKIEEKNETV